MQSLMKEGTPIRKIADTLGRDHLAVSAKHRNLRLEGSGPKKFRAASIITPREWTAEEVSTIQRLRVKGHKVSVIADHIGRTTVSVYNKFKELRNVRVVQYKQGPWTPQELQDFQRMKTERKTSAEISRALNRSYWAVCSAFRRQGLPGIKNSWTAEETAHLLELRAKSTPWFQIAQHFPRRSSSAIRAHYSIASKCPLTESSRRRWTNDETKTLKEMLSAGSSSREIASRLGRSHFSVKHKRYKLLGGNSRRDAEWTENEISALANLRHGGLSWDEIAKTIGNRSAKTCAVIYCNRFGGRATRLPWSEDELATLKRLRTGGSTWKEVTAVIKTRSAGACKRAYAGLTKSG